MTFDDYYSSYVENIFLQARQVMDSDPRAFYAICRNGLFEASLGRAPRGARGAPSGRDARRAAHRRRRNDEPRHAPSRNGDARARLLVWNPIRGRHARRAPEGRVASRFVRALRHRARRARRGWIHERRVLAHRRIALALRALVSSEFADEAGVDCGVFAERRLRRLRLARRGRRVDPRALLVGQWTLLRRRQHRLPRIARKTRRSHGRIRQRPLVHRCAHRRLRARAPAVREDALFVRARRLRFPIAQNRFR